MLSCVSLRSPGMASFSNCCKDGLKSDCQFCNQFLSKYASKALANVGPEGKLRVHSIDFLVQLSLKNKIEFNSFVVRNKSSLNSIFGQPSALSVFAKSVLMPLHFNIHVSKLFKWCVSKEIINI